jgi:hypothetical protein
MRDRKREGIPKKRRAARPERASLSPDDRLDIALAVLAKVGSDARKLEKRLTAMEGRLKEARERTD